MSGEIFLDSGIFIAFLVDSGRLHDEAVSLFSTPPRHWSTSVLVISESYSWFLHRVGEEAARTFRQHRHLAIQGATVIPGPWPGSGPS